MNWEVRYYKTAREELPVWEFIKTQNRDTQAKVAKAINALSEYGPFSKPPLIKKITKHLYELRIQGETSIRIFYTVYNNEFYLLHSFKKQSQKTPPKEIKTALDRANELL